MASARAQIPDERATHDTINEIAAIANKFPANENIQAALAWAWQYVAYARALQKEPNARIDEAVETIKEIFSMYPKNPSIKRAFENALHIQGGWL